MWYNLDKSFPAPATYFDIHTFLPDLISPPVVNFEQKSTDASVAWICSNCNAFNGREIFVKKLMDYLKVDSYGRCMMNKEGLSQSDGNAAMYSKYKFVLAIENSNCEDYVTEKLVLAVASGSIPIVAGKDNKPNYLKFMPKDSYINVYDFKSVQELAKHIEYVASNKTEYEKYIKFKFNHEYKRFDFEGMPLAEIIQKAKTILDPQEIFFSEIVAKETSQNKVCKIASYLSSTPPEQVKAQIKLKSVQRPQMGEVCLQAGDLGGNFK